MEQRTMPSLIEQIRGVSYKPTDLHDSLNPDSITLLRANNIDGGKINFDDVVYVDRKCVSTTQLLRKGDILICASSGSRNLVGKAAQVDFEGEYTFGAFCKVVRPRLMDDAEYIGMFFQSPIYRRTIAEKAQGININNIRGEHIDSMTVCWPDQLDRHKAVETYQALRDCIHLRQHQLHALDTLIKAQFVEMFGDPVANEKGWKTRPLLSMGFCKNGMNFHYDDSGVELNCLGVGDFKDYSVITDTTSLPMVSLNEMPSSEYLLQDDDIVFVRSNGNKRMVGRSIAVYPGDIPTTFSGFCIRYRRTNDLVITPYLLQVLKAESMRQKMYGRGANIQNLNQQTLSSLNIPIPPKEMQEQFAAFVIQVDKSKVVVQAALDETQKLFDSLMQQYFG